MRSGLIGAPGTFRSAGASPVVLLSDVTAVRAGVAFFAWVATGADFADALGRLGDGGRSVLGASPVSLRERSPVWSQRASPKLARAWGPRRSDACARARGLGGLP